MKKWSAQLSWLKKACFLNKFIHFFACLIFRAYYTDGAEENFKIV